MGEKLSLAEKLLREADIEIRSPIDIRKRNACEKAFLAVVQALDELIELKGYPAPERHGERFGTLRQLVREDPEMAKLGLEERYGARFMGAHESCFYGGNIEIAEEEVEKSKKLVEDVKKLLKNAR